jgi:hypothetical protein
MFTGGMSKVTRQYVGKRRSSLMSSVVKLRSGRFMVFTPDLSLKDKGARDPHVLLDSNRLA